jgi:hypothetical protein
MRFPPIFLFLILITSAAFGQISQLVSLEEKYSKKVDVGMSPDEVKRILGKPKAVEGGLPESDSQFVTELPDQVGQINNSTWFYFLPIQRLLVDEPGAEIYIINNERVSKELYESYLHLDTVYFYQGEIEDPVYGRAHALMRDSKLRILPKDTLMSSAITLKGQTLRKEFRPIFCVIFDRGTQVVAATKMLYKID